MEYNNNPYENCEMLSIDGNFLAYTDLKRMNWYLDRNLATKIDDKVYQLNFVTQGDGNENRVDYYKVPLENKCVVCGTDEELTKHHVVPSQYRKHLPLKYKGRNSYDIVIMCDAHHNQYEREADKLKEELLIKYGLENYEKDTQRIVKIFNRLKFYEEYQSIDRIAEMEVDLIDYFDDTIENILTIDKLQFENISTQLMSLVEDVDAFVVMWREHFLEVTKPQHIHEKWINNIKKV